MTQADLLVADCNAATHYAGAARNNNSGKQRKDRGQDATMDKESAAWKEKALFLLRVYVRDRGVGAMFAFEDFRVYAKQCALPEPHSHKVWGAFPSVAKAAGVPIAMTDRTRTASSPRTNGHRVSLWRVTG